MILDSCYIDVKLERADRNYLDRGASAPRRAIGFGKSTVLVYGPQLMMKRRSVEIQRAELQGTHRPGGPALRHRVWVRNEARSAH